MKRQQRMGHPIAERRGLWASHRALPRHIHSLNLEQNEFKLLLGDLEGQEAMVDEPMEVVSLDLNLSAHANVARLHTRRKETREKTSRTMCHAEQAIKVTVTWAEPFLEGFTQPFSCVSCGFHERQELFRSWS